MLVMLLLDLAITLNRLHVLRNQDLLGGAFRATF